jgi:hypothetical protein
MDYTDRPGSNQSPDGTLFNFLAELYGTIGGPPCQNKRGPCNGTRSPVDGAVTSGEIGSGGGDNSLNDTDDAVFIGVDDDSDQLEQSAQNGSGRSRNLSAPERKDLPDWLVEKWQSSVQELIHSQQQRKDGDRSRRRGLGQSSWRLVQDHHARSVQEIDLGENYRLQVHFLKA